MAVSTVSETLEIDAVTSISISDIVLSEDGVNYVRQVDFYTDALDAENRRPVLSVQLFGTQTSLKVNVPSGVSF